MAVYEGLLQRRLELWLNGAWVDFSDRLLTQTLSPNPGRTSGGNRVSPSTIVFSLDNPLGDITPYNATSTYFPHVDVGMLVRWSVFWDGNWHVRGVFEATNVEPHWPYGDLSDGTTTGQPGESYVAISAADILQRLSDNQRQALSAMHRAILADGPTQFWALDDESGSTSAASALTGGAPMAVIGSPTFGDSDAPAGGSGASVDIEGGSLRSQGFVLPASGGFTLEMCAKLTGTPAPSADNLWRLRYASGTLSLDADEITEDGQWHHILFQEEQVGADVVREIWKDGVLDFTFTFVGSTLTYPIGLQLNLEYPAFSSPLKLAYAAIHPHANVSAADRYQALLGWVGETAGRRMERLLAEDGIDFTSAGDLDDTAPMGAQPIATLMDALRNCEDTDLGILHAQREASGLHYRTRADLYNQVPVLVLDAADNELANPFRPSATAKHIVNDVTVSRPDGSSARAISQDSISRVGSRPRNYDANTESDNQLPDMAGWLLNLGTPDGMHYPSVSSELTIATQIIDDWLALNLGDRIQVVNLPPQHPSGTVDLLVDGYTEPHSPGRWTPQINCSPAAPWDVAELDDDDLGKLDTDGSELITAVNSSATTLTVLTTNVDSPLWTTDSGEMPIPLIVAGEVMSVTDVDPAFSDAFGRVTASGWGTSDSGHAWTTTGGAAADYSTTGSRAQIAFTAAGLKQTQAGDSYDDLIIVGQVLPTEVSTGAPVDIGLTVRRNSSSNDCYELLLRFETTSVIAVRVNKVVAGAASNIAANAVGTAYSAGSIFWIKAALQGDRIRVKAWNTSASEPDWHLDFTDSSVTAAGQIGAVCRVQGGNTNIPVSPQWDAIQVTNPQVMTVTRSVNGVAKSQSAGTAVNVYRPARLAL